MEIINTTKDNSEYIKKLEIASLEKTKEIFIEHIEDFVKELPFEISQKIKLDIRASNDFIYADIFIGEDCYDWIIEQPETCVDPVEYSCIKDIDFTVDGFPARIAFFFHCYVPIEDLELYRSLGKIHKEVIPESVSESLYCEF